MKKLLMSAAFVAVIATPAFAQSYNPDFGGANVNAPYQARSGAAEYGSFAYAPAPRKHSRHWRAMHSQDSVNGWVQRENLNIPFEDHREDREY